jgi:hypothetical protein
MNYSVRGSNRCILISSKSHRSLSSLEDHVLGKVFQCKQISWKVGTTAFNEATWEDQITWEVGKSLLLVAIPRITQPSTRFEPSANFRVTADCITAHARFGLLSFSAAFQPFLAFRVCAFIETTLCFMIQSCPNHYSFTDLLSKPSVASLLTLWHDSYLFMSWVEYSKPQRAAREYFLLCPKEHILTYIIFRYTELEPHNTGVSGLVWFVFQFPERAEP